MSEEVLQTAMKRREVKDKGEKERYTHLDAEFQRTARRDKAFLSDQSKEKKERCIHFNAEFQRIARRDKKAFLSDQCKEIEGKNGMGKTRDLVKKVRDTKGTFHAKMGTIKDRNSMDLKEAEDIKKRWQEYAELYCSS